MAEKNAKIVCTPIFIISELSVYITDLIDIRHVYIIYYYIYLPSFLLFRDYVEMENKWCGPKLGKEYPRLLDAQTACDQDRNCRMFYDIKSENKAFVLCGSDSYYDNLYNNFNYYEVKRSEFLRSRLYMKCKFYHITHAEENLKYIQ